MSRLLRFVLATLIFSLPLFAVDVSGPITSDTTWSIGAGAVMVTGTVTIPAGITLTIEQYVEVKFDPGTALIVAGKIVADGVTFTSYRGGTESEVPGDWIGIEFQNTADENSVFKNNSVNYAGDAPNGAAIFYRTGAPDISIFNCYITHSAGNGIDVKASSPLIRNSYLENNLGYGLFTSLVSNFVLDSSYVSYNALGGVQFPTSSSPQITNSYFSFNNVGIDIANGASPIIRNNIIEYNNIGILIPYASGPQPLIRFNQIKDNTTWGLLNSGNGTVTQADSNYWGSDTGPYNSFSNTTGLGNAVSNLVKFEPWLRLGVILPVISVTANIATPTTWVSGYVYWVKNDITVSTTLTIQPGVIVKCSTGVSITVNSTGSINAVGTPDSLIVFTSQRDDAYGGNTNVSDADSNLAPAPGIWDRVELNGFSGFPPHSLKYCLFRYGGYSSVGNLYFTNSCSLSVVSNIFSNSSSNYGVRINGVNLSLDNATITGNQNHGIYIGGASNVTIRSSVIQGNAPGNTSYKGIYADGSAQLNVRSTKILNNGYGIEVNSTTALLQSLDSCVISFNTGWGVYQNNGNGPQRFSYNRIEGNVGGFWINNTSDTALFLADTVVGNTQEGIVTTKGNLLGNVISNNRYPIGLIGRLGSKYSGNILTGNTFNNAIALRLNGPEFSDTLSVAMPSGITAYVLIENTGGGGVASGQTLFIEPGAVVKFGSNMYMSISGTLIADGTPVQPIVFTSYRDSSYGGKTIAANDFSAPAKGDWYYVRLINATSGNSLMDNCVFKYGGGGSNGMLYTYNVTFADTFTNLTLTQSYSQGIYSYATTGIFADIRSDSNASHGLYIYGTSPASDVKVLDSKFQYNNGSGLYADNGSAFRVVDHCDIKNNTANGITATDGKIPQYYYGNVVQYNIGNGIQLWNPSLKAGDITIIGNNVWDNGKTGVVSTASTFIDNDIQRNNYPIGVWGKLGNVYSGTDVIIGNAYNNAIAIQGGNLEDTLASVFPAAIPSKVYHVIDDIAVGNADTLVIMPGSKIKFVKLQTGTYNIDFTIYGTLFAEGTPAQPVIFTSWRDSTVGAKTALPADFIGPAPGDWNYLIFYSGSGNSRARYCEFKYGGGDGYTQLYFYDNVGTIVFSNNKITESYSDGIYIYSTALTLDTCIIEYNNGNGIYVYSNIDNFLNIRGCKILYNNDYGMYIDGTGKLQEISGSTIANNSNTGLYVYNNTVPLTIIGSKFMNNSKDGLYINAFNDAVDTLLYIAGTNFTGNGGAGVVSSRAHFLGDTISGNVFPIGVIGQLSLANTQNAMGNVFLAGNYVQGNMYNDIILAEGYIEGNLGYSFPPGNNFKVITSRDDISVNSGKTLNVAPGTIFKLRENTEGIGRLNVYGKILAAGQANNKIVFTSWNDTTYDLSTIVDTTAGQPQLGDWDMIYLQGNDSSLIRNTIIKYGGYYGYAGLYFSSDNSTVDSSSIFLNSSSGIYVSNSNPVIFANTIHQNYYGINVDGSSNPVISYNSIFDNDYGMYVYYPSGTLNAASNYWGSATGPLKTTGNVDSLKNPSGQGNEIYVYGSGDVNWKPPLFAPGGILYGDVSGNGQIAAYDASLALRHDAELDTLNPVQIMAADVNKDASVDAFDASLILRYVVGIISDFGLGKRSLETEALSAFVFRIEKNQQPNHFDLVIHLNKPVNVYSASVKLAYDTALVTPLSMAQGEASDSMLLAHYFPKGKANVALAGVYPLNDEGDIVRFTFRLEGAGRSQEKVLFTVKRFVLNGVDVTTDTGPIILDVKDVADVPATFALGQNYPNPFNPATSIKYQVPEESRVTITVYNLLGQRVRTLVNDVQAAGYYTLRWNGSDEHGASIASGVYIYRIEAMSSGNKKFVDAKKMILIK